MEGLSVNARWQTAWMVIVIVSMCEVAYADQFVWELDRCGGEYKPPTVVGSDIEQTRTVDLSFVNNDSRVRMACKALGLRNLPVPFTSDHGAIALFTVKATSREWTLKFSLIFKEDWREVLGIR